MLFRLMTKKDPIPSSSSDFSLGPKRSAHSSVVSVIKWGIRNCFIALRAYFPELNPITGN